MNYQPRPLPPPVVNQLTRDQRVVLQASAQSLKDLKNGR